MRWVCCILVLCLLGTAAEAAEKTPGQLQIGESLRDATLQGLNGSPRKLSEFRGKPLIINMWASWCGPCRAEMASLERLAWLDPAGPVTGVGILEGRHSAPNNAALTK